MSVKPIVNYDHIPIRTIKIVVDVEDVFAPELTLEEFLKLHGTIPEPPKYRIINVEVVTCTEDNQPVLVTECGRCQRFVRRFQGHISCRKTLTIP
jgi:hypothetical protein